MKVRMSDIRRIIREEIEGMEVEAKTSKYDDEMKKAGFSKQQAKKLPDELQAGILKRRLKREGG